MSRKKASRRIVAILLLLLLWQGCSYVKFRYDLIATGVPHDLSMFRNLEKLEWPEGNRLGAYTIDLAYYDPANHVIQIGYRIPRNDFIIFGLDARQLDLRVDGTPIELSDYLIQDSWRGRRCSILLRDQPPFREITLEYYGARVVLTRP